MTLKRLRDEDNKKIFAIVLLKVYIRPLNYVHASITKQEMWKGSDSDSAKNAKEISTRGEEGNIIRRMLGDEKGDLDKKVSTFIKCANYAIKMIISSCRFLYLDWL